jgi:hypothetical protein
MRLNMHFGIRCSMAVMLLIVLEKCNSVIVDAVVVLGQSTEMLWKG